jgi:trimethylamine:corrinoid methyltransferase-like protein
VRQAYDVVASVGPGSLRGKSHCGALPHEYWRPALSDRSGLEAWMDMGGSALNRAVNAGRNW